MVFDVGLRWRVENRFFIFILFFLDFLFWGFLRFGEEKGERRRGGERKRRLLGGRTYF